MSAMKALSEATTYPVNLPLDAYFLPNSTDVFTLHYPGEEPKAAEGAPRLTVNGIPMDYNSTSNSFMSTRMRGGQTYLLTASFPASQLQWSTPKLLPAPINDKMLLPSAITRQASEINAAILRVATVFQVFSLTAEELGSFAGALQAQQAQGTRQQKEQSSLRMLAFDLNAPSLKDLIQFHKYCDLRRNSSPPTIESQGSPLMATLSWLGTTASAKMDDLASNLAAGTCWNKTRVLAALQARYTDAANPDTGTSLAALRNIDALYSLYTVMELDDKLGKATGALASQPSMATLFQLAQPLKVLAADDSSTARSLQFRQSTDGEPVACPGRIAPPAADADGLFEHFLIDVQMGPQLCTSRTKQAISVVQLFVQRCLLGLEPDVPKGCQVRAKRDWMQQYSLWEVNRKLFLYPENWLDPALRDDKSALFEKFDASLMQKNLSIATFVDGIRAYIAGLNEISSLDVVAYAHEPTKGLPIPSTSHTFYYRTVAVQWPSGARLRRPWSKIDIDIPSVESDWNGAYLLPVLAGGSRLYLFLPHIMLRTLDRKPDESEKKKRFEALHETKIQALAPRRIWETTMAWTELANGQWSPKRMSPGSVTVESPTMPAATDFRVDTVHNSTTGSLTLLVSHTSATDGRATVVGYFVFREDQISAVDLAVNPSAAVGIHAHDRMVRNSFQQISVKVEPSSPETQYTKLSLPSASTESDPAWQRPVDMMVWVPAALDTLNRKATGGTIELPQGQGPSEKLIWTLAMESKESRLTCLALSANRSDGTSRSYFQVPKTEMRSMWWTANNMHNLMDSVVMDHVSATGLMQAAVDRTNPLQSVFNLIASSASAYGLETFGAYGKKLCHELGQPSALYNWEIGLHAVMLAMDRFHATQQFDEALQVARLVFDPTVDVEVQRLIKQVNTKGEDGKHAVVSEVVVSPLAASASALLSTDTAKVTLEARSQSVGSAWRFPPFQDISRRIAAVGKKGTMGAGFDANRELEAAILERRSHSALVHATARGRPEAYMKWILMKYVEIPVASGDIHFRKGTLESLHLATQRYMEATHVLGPEPPLVTRFGERNSVGCDSTFEDLSRGREPWNFERLCQEDMRFAIRLPFSPELELLKGAAAKGDKDMGKENIVGFLLTPYFGVPVNSKFRQIRSVIKQRLFNVRNSLDIDGRPITYALTEPSIDPGALVALSAAGFDNASASAMVIGDQDSSLPRQRFDVLIHRALELCGEVRALGERLVNAIEKETEAFGVLRAKHATAIQRTMYSIKETHMTEAQQTIDSLRLNRDSVVSQLAYYLALLGESESLIPNEKSAWSDLKQDIDKPTQDDLRMSQHEQHEMNMATAAMALNVVLAGIDTLVAPFCMVPSVSINSMPMGIGTIIAAGGGSTISNFMQAGPTALKMAAMVVAEQGSQAARKVQLTRQMQDRRLQANMRGRKIKSIDTQIEIQRTRLRTAQQELQLQESEVQESVQVETWLRSKYTNEALYSWVEKSLRSLYFQAYTLAMSTARSAESALAFEDGRKLSILRPGGYWDASRDGLLAADHLYLDPKRLEAAHREGRRHDYEISKTISPRQVDPMALMRLRISGSTTFSLSEMLFDLDFPGHYMRRIHSVAVSIPAVLSPHSGVNATLTLQQHKYRVLQTAATPEEYAASWSTMSASNDEAFRTDRVPISAVAISSGTHDAVVFELNFAGDRYLPFEGAGVVSSWRLDLPTEVPRFDYNSIADVQLHVQYTSLDGGASLRAAANGAVRKALKAIDNSGTGRDNGFWAMWNLKNDFVNEWYEFSGQLTAAREDKSAAAGQREIAMTLGDLAERLPFWARDLGQLEVRGITLVSKNVGLVDAMSVSVVPGLWDSKSILDWRVWSRQKLEETDWKGWEFKAKAGSLKADDTVGDVYMLVRYGKKS
ncbi:hypothetical protein IFM46972_10688 [Aspergillus udagawae]|uniref:Tc toxin complex TcA C-terminal TcB-binding domain-containing protein n=1 Tax=Aspergillus udagawae TaxID=91492 RepID=A0A8H3XQ53_9EURO|nr:hypothetical protein IFM46972_10688 [Aspergillus udagawae]